MAHKGSKYSQKHNIIIDVKQNDLTEQHPALLLDIIYDDISFLDTFSTLDINEQIQIYTVLKKLSESPTKNMTRAERTLIRESSYKLDKINKWAGLKKEEMLRYPLSQDEHHIIRMDFYGSVDARPLHQLSPHYKTFSNKRLSETLPPSAYKLDSLKDAPGWQIFRQFKNFRDIEKTIQNFLSEQRYNPQMLKLMGIKDYSDLIFQTFKNDEKKLKVSFLNHDNERNTFVKIMARDYGEKIRTILQHYKWDERCISSMLNAMMISGTTDANKIVVTEEFFNDRIIQDLNNAKLGGAHFKSGDRIPLPFIEYLSERDDLKLIQAVSEDGVPLKCPHGFEVHHKVAVSESGRLSSIAAVNYPTNFLLVGPNMHQNVLHLFDKLVKTNGKEAYRCRIELEKKNTAFMNGFAPTDQFEVDWQQSPDLTKRIEADNLHIISYDLVADTIAENRATYFNRKGQFDVDTVVTSLLKNCSKKRRNKTRG